MLPLLASGNYIPPRPRGSSEALLESVAWTDHETSGTEVAPPRAAFDAVGVPLSSCSKRGTHSTR